MASSNQGGSILSFLIIGGVLTALLIGGAYFVQQRSTVSDKDKTPVVTQPAAQSNDATDKKQTSPNEDKKVVVEPKKEPTKTEATPQPEAQKPAAQPVAPPPAAQLPKTGPTESLIGVFAAGLLTFIGLSYLQSRKIQA